MITGLRTVAVILWCVAGMSGCASGPDQQHAYHLTNPAVTQRGSGLLALVVQDQRPYVLSGTKRSTFVGLSRGTVGQPYDVTTSSRQSLAADFTTSIRRGLERAGYRVTTPDVGDRVPLTAVGIALSQTGAARGLAVQIQDWKLDTYSGTVLHHAVKMQAFDAAGQEIGRTAISGADTLVIGGHFIDPAERAAKAAADAHARKLEELLNAPAIRRALIPPTGAPAERVDRQPSPVDASAPAHD